MKKVIFIVVGLVVVVGLVLGFFLLRSKSIASPQSSEETVKIQAKESLPTLELAIGKKPYVALIPRFDGKALTLVLENFGLAKSADYELTYQTEGLTRGAMGNVKLEGKESFSQELLLGSCSKNVCTYDKNVEFGSLTVKVNYTAGVSEDKLDFHLQKVGSTGISLASQNNDIVVEIPAGMLNGQYILTMSTGGLVKELANKKIVVGPYGIFTSGGKLTKPVSLALNTPAGTTNISLYLYDSTKKDWTKISGSLSLGKYTAQVANLGVFVLAKDKIITE